MRIAAELLVFTIVCLLLLSILYFSYVVVAVVSGGIAGMEGAFRAIATLVVYLAAAMLFACLTACFMLGSPLDSLGCLTLMGAWSRIIELIGSLMS